MTEKAASAGVFVELISKSHGEITWKREKKLLLDRISTLGTTFRATRRKIRGFLFSFKNETFAYLKVPSSTFSWRI